MSICYCKAEACVNLGFSRRNVVSIWDSKDGMLCQSGILKTEVCVHL